MKFTASFSHFAPFLSLILLRGKLGKRSLNRRSVSVIGGVVAGCTYSSYSRSHSRSLAWTGNQFHFSRCRDRSGWESISQSRSLVKWRSPPERF